MQTFIPWVHIFSFSVWLSANLFVLGLLLPASRGLGAGAGRGAVGLAARGLNRVVAAAAPVAVASGLAGVLLSETAAPLAPGSGAFLLLVAKVVLTAVMVVNHGLQAFRYHACLEQPLDSRNPWLRLLVANAVLGVVVLLLGLRRAAL